MRDDSTVFFYKLCLTEKMRSFQGGYTEQQYERIKDIIHSAAKEALGEKVEFDESRCRQNLRIELISIEEWKIYYQQLCRGKR